MCHLKEWCKTDLKDLDMTRKYPLRRYIVAPLEKLSNLTIQGVNFLFSIEVKEYADGAFEAIKIMNMYLKVDTTTQCNNDNNACEG